MLTYFWFFGLDIWQKIYVYNSFLDLCLFHCNFERTIDLMFLSFSPLFRSNFTFRISPHISQFLKQTRNQFLRISFERPIINFPFCWLSFLISTRIKLIFNEKTYTCFLLQSMMKIQFKVFFNFFSSFEFFFNDPDYPLNLMRSLQL